MAVGTENELHLCNETRLCGAFRRGRSGVKLWQGASDLHCCKSFNEEPF